MRFVRLDDREIEMKSSVSETISCASCEVGKESAGDVSCAGGSPAAASGGLGALRVCTGGGPPHQELSVPVVQLAEVGLEHLSHELNVGLSVGFPQGIRGGGDEGARGGALRGGAGSLGLREKGGRGARAG